MPTDIKLQELLFSACVDRNLDTLKALLQQDPTLAQLRNRYGGTALLQAAGNGQLSTVQWLLAEGGASITERNTHGSTALLMAAQRGQLPTMQWLLTEGGANVTEQDMLGDTALLWAAYNGHLPTVQWLLTEGGASITERNTHGSTALLVAAYDGQLPTVQWLLTKGGASITERDTQGGTALLLAAQRGHLPTVQWLLTKGGASYTRRTDGYTALLTAAYKGQLSIVQWLLTSGHADICETTDQSTNALEIAMGNKHEETALFLYHYGKSRGMSIRNLSQANVRIFENLKQEEAGLVRVIAKAASVGFLPEAIIKIIHAYALVCLSASEEERLFNYEMAVLSFEAPRNRLQILGKAELLNSLFAKDTPVPAGTIPAIADIAAIKTQQFHLHFLMEYTQNSDVPLERNPIHALVQEKIRGLEEKNEALIHTNVDVFRNYMFILNAVRALAALGAVAGIVSIIAASTLLSCGALIGVAIAGVVVLAASTYCFFKAHKMSQQQNVPPMPVEKAFHEVAVR